jgi:hypothetical protein
MRLLSNAHLFNLSLFCGFVQDWTEDFWKAPSQELFSGETLAVSIKSQTILFWPLKKFSRSTDRASKNKLVSTDQAMDYE